MTTVIGICVFLNLIKLRYIFKNYIVITGIIRTDNRIYFVYNFLCFGVKSFS